VGVINVPIIYFSVNWWNTLHQGATIRMFNKPTITGIMVLPMLILLAACWLYSVAVVLMRLRCIILEREQEQAVPETIESTLGDNLARASQGSI
jgi:heme exporter protein C